MNPIDSYKNSYKYTLNNNEDIINNQQQFNLNNIKMDGFFERFPESTRKSSKEDLRILDDRNMNPFNLENKVLASADLFQTNYTKKSNFKNEPSNLIQTNASNNSRDDSNNRLQSFNPIPTSSAIPIINNLQLDNKIAYPIQTRNNNYSSINSDIEKKNKERSEIN